MEFEGRMWKDGRYWLVEVPILDAMTQGKSKKDALRMIEDAVMGLVECYFEGAIGSKLGIKAFLRADNFIGLTAKDSKILLALSLIKQREKSHATVREISKRLGSKSPNAYAQYEKGRLSVTFEKFEELIMAVTRHRQIRVGII
jgi:predicted RNase H-like HicB family nuclease